MLYWPDVFAWQLHRFHLPSVHTASLSKTPTKCDGGYYFMKHCTRCNNDKDESEFGKHSSEIDGLRYMCKMCQAVYHREWRSETGKKYTKNKECLNKATAKYIGAYPERRKARQYVNNRIYRGEISVPKVCQYCHKKRKLQAHHHKGYDRENWLDVVFICSECHGKTRLKYMEHNNEHGR